MISEIGESFIFCNVVCGCVSQINNEEIGMLLNSVVVVHGWPHVSVTYYRKRYRNKKAVESWFGSGGKGCYRQLFFCNSNSSSKLLYDLRRALCEISSK